MSSVYLWAEAKLIFKLCLFMLLRQPVNFHLFNHLEISYSLDKNIVELFIWDVTDNFQIKKKKGLEKPWCRPIMNYKIEHYK